jgi:hypothetical protein
MGGSLHHHGGRGLRLEEDGVPRSWPVPHGMPDVPRHNRLAVAVPDHELDRLTYADADKGIVDIGWRKEADRTSRPAILGEPSGHGQVWTKGISVVDIVVYAEESLT